MEMILQNKTAIITGASGSIGQAIAIEFANHGADVLICYNHNKKRAQGLADQIESFGRRALTCQVDVVDRSAVRKMVGYAKGEFGSIDVLVNSAGLVRDALFMTMSENAWREVMDTNLLGVFNCCKEVTRIMLRQKSGTVVNIASLSGVSGRAGQCNYSAAKGAIISFTKSLAQEMARFGIRVNALAPGVITSTLTESLARDPAFTKLIPLGRFGRPEEVAKSALFLASEMSTYITGAVLHVNGGLFM